MAEANAPITMKEVPTVVKRFQELFAKKDYKEAAELVAESHGEILRTPNTMAIFQSVHVQAGQTLPLLQYFGILLTRGKLNVYESLELSRLVVNQNKKNLLENWLAEDKLECSEELGDFVKTVDNELSLKIYIKARVTPKVLAAFVERREFEKILTYSKQVGYTPDYMFLLQTILCMDPQGAENFALTMSQFEGGCPVDYNTITNLFIERNLIHETTTFLLDVLKPNLPEHAFLQTKVLEINLITFPEVADAILEDGMLSHYDRPLIAQLCEKANLYIQCLKVNPANALFVLGQLMDNRLCREDFITDLILSVHSLLLIEPLISECEKRNRLPLLTQYLEHLVSEGSQDVNVHNALGKIIIDSNNNPKHFLTTNPYYDSKVVGKYCKKRDPTLAVVAYRRGQCDEELINVTNKNSLFKLQAIYVVERMDGDLWAKVLTKEYEYRRQLIDQVVSTALPESKSLGQVSATVKAFMTVDLPHELIELLEKIVLQNSAFSGNLNLQNLLILTAIKAYPSRVMDYINMLDNFDRPAVGEVAVDAQLYEEAFAIFKKSNLNVRAVNVSLDNVRCIKSAVEFAFQVEENDVWSQVAKAQLKEGLVSDAIESFIRADDATQFLEVIRASKDTNIYDDLVRYLWMVREKVEEPKVDTELIYSYGKTERLDELKEFLLMPNVANLQNVGDRLCDEALGKAAKIIYEFILARTLAKLQLL